MEIGLYDYNARCYAPNFNQWRGNDGWWNLIRTAQVGDIIFMSSAVGEFAASFMGEGQEVLLGIQLSDPYGNALPDSTDLNGMPSNFGFQTILNKGFISEIHRGWVHFSIIINRGPSRDEILSYGHQ